MSEVYVGWIYAVSGLGKVRVTNEFVHFVRPDQSRDYMTREDFEARIVGEPEPPVQSVVVTARKRATR